MATEPEAGHEAGDANGEAALLALARDIRGHGSILPQDLTRLATAEHTTGDGTATRVFGKTLRLALWLLGSVLGAVRALVVVAAGLAVLNTALFLVPRRDQSTFWIGAAIVLLVMLLPALALNRVGKRFAAFREAVVTIGAKLPAVFTIPDTVVSEAREIAQLTESTAEKRLPGRLLARARLLVRLKRMIDAFVDEHRDLFSATVTATTYGPQDVVLTLYGIVGIAVLGVLVPAFALAAVLA